MPRNGAARALDGPHLPRPRGRRISSLREELIGILKDNLKLVVLNACFSESLADALTQHVACAIGMGQSISDQAALTFAESFYRAIGFGRSVAEAFELGRVAFRTAKIPEDQIPRLKVKPGEDAARMVLLRRK